MNIHLPRVVWWFIWAAIAVLVIILVAFLVHLAGGGMWSIRLGHFIWRLGVT